MMARFVCSILLALGLGSAAAADITEDDLYAFLDATFAPWPEDVAETGEAAGLETRLIGAFQNNETANATIDAFAGAIGRDRETAEATARILIDTAIWAERCHASDEGVCDIVFDNTMRLRLDRARQLPDAAELEEIILTSVSGVSSPAAVMAFLSRAGGDFGATMRARFMEEHRPAFAAAAIDARAADDGLFDAILRRRDHTLAAGLYLALFEHIMDLPVTTEAEAERNWFASFNFVRTALDAGLEDEALAVYRTYTAGDGPDFWQFAGPETRQLYNLGNRRQDARLNVLDREQAELMIALAALAIERRDDSLADTLLDMAEERYELAAQFQRLRGCERPSELDLEWLSTSSMSAILEQLDEIYNPDEGCQRVFLPANLAFLIEYRNPVLSSDQAFDMLVLGRPLDNEDDRYTARPWVGDGTLFGVGGDGSLFRLKIRYMRQHGYDSLAESRRNVRYCDEPYGESGIVPDSLGELGGPLYPRIRHFEAEVSGHCVVHDWNRMATEAERQALAELLPNPRPAYFTERPVAEAAGLDRAPESVGQPPEGFPAPDATRLRSEFDGTEWTVVYESRGLDPVGELPVGGLWIVRTRENGTSWNQPYYLGLQTHFPYRVESDSPVPLFRNGIVRLAVIVDEIDRRTISFPPVGLRSARRERGLYLEFAWADLVRDSDGDGLTDIYEHRVALDYRNTDTDGDGMPDGSDPVPSVALDPDLPEQSDFFATLFAPLLGQEARAILTAPPREAGADPGPLDIAALFQDMRRLRPEMPDTMMLSGDAETYASLRFSQTRLIVHPEPVFDALALEYAPALPFRFSVIQPNRTGTVWYVVWTAHWVGGSFLIRLTENGYEIEELGSWIT